MLLADKFAVHLLILLFNLLIKVSVMKTLAQRLHLTAQQHDKAKMIDHSCGILRFLMPNNLYVVITLGDNHISFCHFYNDGSLGSHREVLFDTYDKLSDDDKKAIEALVLIFTA